MKKLSYVISGTGLAIFGVAGSCDYTEHPIIVIPIIIGAILMLAGYYIERSWVFEEEEDFECDCSCNDDADDDGITYITYDSKGNKRYMDMR